jgi:ParB/RepB/Spo0J family partition protein
VEVPVDSLKPDPNQPRKTFPAEVIENIALTIKRQGTINPIEVDDENVIITGEVRWRGAKKAGLKTIPIKRISKITPQERFERQMVENLHHSVLEPKEREEAIYSLYKSGRYGSPIRSDRGTISRLANALGYTSGTISIIIEAKEARQRLSVPDDVPTTMIGETAGLDDRTRVELLKKIQKGEIKQTNSQTQLREAVKIVKRAPEPIKKKFLEGEIRQEEAQRIVDVYEKAPEPLRKAIARGEVEPEKAERAVKLYEKLAKDGVDIEATRVSIHVEELKKETRADKAQAKILEETAKEVLTGRKEAFDTMMMERGHAFVREVRDVAWKVKGWGIPTMMRVGVKSWKEAQVYFKQIREQMDFLLRAEPTDKGD